MDGGKEWVKAGWKETVKVAGLEEAGRGGWVDGDKIG